MAALVTGTDCQQDGFGVLEAAMNDHDKHDDDKAAADEETEIAWHRKQIAENSTILHELEAGNQSGGEVFPETQNEIDHLRDQIAQSELIVAAYEKKNPSSA